MENDFRYIGQPVERLDGREKVTGRALYVDDLSLPGMLFGKTIRSPIARGRIKQVHFDPSIPWQEFTIADARDVPGKNLVKLIVDDQPLLADGEIRHREEPVLLIAYPDRQMVEKAAHAIRLECEEAPGIFEIGPGPVGKEIRIESGNLEEAFRASDLVLERTYRTGAQEHAYIEPQGMLAYWEGDRVTVRGSLQCPYYIHDALKVAFGLKDEQINVCYAVTGGAFGGKEEFPSQVALNAALLARKAGRPVKLVYDRKEDMACSTKRHPSVSIVRAGVTRDGVLLALDFDFRLDQGAYVTLTPVVLSRSVLHAAGCYRWAAARIRGRSFFTNSPPYGAFRGFGAPQSIFALETHLSLLADRLGMDPAELRRRNFLRKGDAMPTGQVLKEDPNLNALMERALEISDYRAKRSTWKRGSGRGIGLSTFMHGGGFTGSGETFLASRVALVTREDGKVEILQSNVDIGQGTETVFPQIAAEALGIPIEDAVFRRPATGLVPNSGPTVASRTCMVVGKLVQRAAEQLRARLGGASVREHFAQQGPLRVEVQYQPPEGVQWDDATYRGSAYAAYAWSCNVAEVRVDPLTAEIKVEKITSTVDVGTVLNPVLARGQVEGGVAQAVGWATSEEVRLRQGAMENTELMNYIVPTPADAPEIEVEFMPQPYPEGGYGSKGLGELPMNGPAPAIASAIFHATEKVIDSVPVLPEHLLSEGSE